MGLPGQCVGVGPAGLSLGRPSSLRSLEGGSSEPPPRRAWWHCSPWAHGLSAVALGLAGRCAHAAAGRVPWPQVSWRTTHTGEEKPSTPSRPGGRWLCSVL